jgi:hypothetical protein
MVLIIILGSLKNHDLPIYPALGLSHSYETVLLKNLKISSQLKI